MLPHHQECSCKVNQNQEMVLDIMGWTKLLVIWYQSLCSVHYVGYLAEILVLKERHLNPVNKWMKYQ
jgi:hypothetical protein